MKRKLQSDFIVPAVVMTMIILLACWYHVVRKNVNVKPGQVWVCPSANPFKPELNKTNVVIAVKSGWVQFDRIELALLVNLEPIMETNRVESPTELFKAGSYRVK